MTQRLPDIGVWLYWGQRILEQELQTLWDRGVRHLYFKLGDGQYVSDLVISRMQEIRDNGWLFHLHVWYFVHGLDDLGVAAAAAQRLDIPRERFILDMEGSWEGVDYDMVSEGLERLPSEELYCTSFAFPDLHPRFPWRAFSERDIKMLPQLFPGIQGLSAAVGVLDLAKTSREQHEHLGLKIDQFCWQLHDNRVPAKALAPEFWYAALDWTLLTGAQELSVFRLGPSFLESRGQGRRSDSGPINWTAIADWYSAHTTARSEEYELRQDYLRLSSKLDRIREILDA